jgi:hypothetical protein
MEPVKQDDVLGDWDCFQEEPDILQFIVETSIPAMIQRTQVVLAGHEARMNDRGETLAGYLKLAPSEKIGEHQFIVDEMQRMKLIDHIQKLQRCLN